MWKSLKKSHSQNGTFCLSGCLSFLIEYISEQYIVLVFMILSALLIWFLSTEMPVNVVGFFVRKSLSYFQVKSIIHGFANKVRQSYRGEFNVV